MAKRSTIQCYYIAPPDEKGREFRCPFLADPKIGFHCGIYHKQLWQEKEYPPEKLKSSDPSYFKLRTERLRNNARRGGEFLING